MTFGNRRRGTAVRSATAAFVLILLFPGCHRTTARTFRPPAKIDVVLVTIDTLRADAPGFAGNGRVSTPNLDRIAREGVVFTQAHAHNVVTLPSHVNILTGLYPYQHGVRDNDGFRLPDNVPTMATLLKSKGFATAAFIGAFPLDSRFGLSRGFDVYDQHYPEGAHAYDFVMPERPAAEVVDAARRWFAKMNASRRFLWVHLYDCHAPYRPPPPFDRVYADNLYLGEVAGVDAALGPLLADLRSDPTPVLLIVTGDHGEALGDHGELTHGLFAYEATLHIPLVVWCPKYLKPGSDAGMARHVDILPTVLEAAAVVEPISVAGASLFRRPPPPNETSYFESLSAFLNRGWAPLRGVIGDGEKYIELPIPELYNLVHDPAESKNIFDPRATEIRRLHAALASDQGKFARESAVGDTTAKLRNLGYLAGSAVPQASYGPEDDPKSLVSSDQRLHRIVDEYQRGHLDEAIKLAQSVVAERPRMQTGYDFLSFLQTRAGSDTAAINTLAEANRLGLLSEELITRWGLLLAGSGRAREALGVLQPLAGRPDPELQNALGIARVGAGDLAGGMAAFQLAGRLAPADGSSWQNMGIALLENGRTAPAIEAFEHAFRLNDRLPRAWNAYGVALERSKRSGDAIAAWKRAVEIDPEQYDALYNIALVAGQIGDREAEREALGEFLTRAPATRYELELRKARLRLSVLSAAQNQPVAKK